MDYKGRHPIFDPSSIKTYPASQRANKVSLKNLSDPAKVLDPSCSAEPDERISELADLAISGLKAGKPVILFTGAHLVKNGLGPLVADLVRRKALSLVATNGAGIIHDFELCLFGETSESVPNALPEGSFGMAAELGYINACLSEGHRAGIGYGESMGLFISDKRFRKRVERRLKLKTPIHFRHPEISIISACYAMKIPLTVHVGIGTDVTDQHPNFDGAAKGGCSGRDFLIFSKMVTRLAGGGVVLNVGSAVTGPEVLLKAVSMAGNVGMPPTGLVTADFDLKPYHAEKMKDESDCNYYFRHHKSVVARVPEAFGGKGFSIQGDQRTTFPLFYREIVKRLSAGEA